MADLVNVGVPQVMNRAFVALAVESGIESVLKSLLGLAMDQRQLLERVIDALEETNPTLAAAMNMDSLMAVIEYMQSQETAAVATKDHLPTLLNESGPASVSAARDGGVNTQVNITFSAPPEGYKAELYLDGIFQKVVQENPSAGFVNTLIANVSPGSHTIRVLFRNGDGDITKFGPIAAVV